MVIDNFLIITDPFLMTIDSFSEIVYLLPMVFNTFLNDSRPSINGNLYRVDPRQWTIAPFWVNSIWFDVVTDPLWMSMTIDSALVSSPLSVFTESLLIVSELPTIVIEPLYMVNGPC